MHFTNPLLLLLKHDELPNFVFLSGFILFSDIFSAAAAAPAIFTVVD